MDIDQVLKSLGITADVIIDRAVSKILESDDGEINHIIQSRISEVVSKAAPPIIAEKLSTAIEDTLSTDYQPVDEWGEPVGKAKTNLREMVKQRARGFLEEKVDRDGKATNYSAVGTRAEWLVHAAADKAFTYEAKKEIEKAVQKAHAEVKKLVADHIQKTLLSR